MKMSKEVTELDILLGPNIKYLVMYHLQIIVVGQTLHAPRLSRSRLSIGKHSSIVPYHNIDWSASKT